MVLYVREYIEYGAEALEIDDERALQIHEENLSEFRKFSKKFKCVKLFKVSFIR